MNTTTLNMTTLDGGVIIKKETAPAPPSGGESGGSNWRFFDVTGMGDMAKYMTEMALLVKGENDNYQEVCIVSSYGIMANNAQNIQVYAIAWDESISMVSGGTVVQGKDIIGMIMSQSGVTEITKEQFYDLNA